MLKILDSGFRRNDERGRFQTFYEFAKLQTIDSNEESLSLQDPFPGREEFREGEKNRSD